MMKKLALLIILVALYCIPFAQSVPTCKLDFNPPGHKPSIGKNESFKIYFVYVWAGWIDGNSQVFFSDIHEATGTFSDMGNSTLFGSNVGMTYGWKEFMNHCKEKYSAGNSSDRPCAISEFAPIWAHTSKECLGDILEFYKGCVTDAGGYYNDPITVTDFEYKLSSTSKTSFSKLNIQLKGGYSKPSSSKTDYTTSNPSTTKSNHDSEDYQDLKDAIYKLSYTDQNGDKISYFVQLLDENTNEIKIIRQSENEKTNTTYSFDLDKVESVSTRPLLDESYKPVNGYYDLEIVIEDRDGIEVEISNWETYDIFHLKSDILMLGSNNESNVDNVGSILEKIK